MVEAAPASLPLPAASTTTHTRHPPRPGQAHAAIHDDTRTSPTKAGTGSRSYTRRHTHVTHQGRDRLMQLHDDTRTSPTKAGTGSRSYTRRHTHVTHQGRDRLTQLYTTTHARHPPRPGQAHAAIHDDTHTSPTKAGTGSRSYTRRHTHVTHQGRDRLTQLYTTTHTRHPPRPGQAHAAIHDDTRTSPTKAGTGSRSYTRRHTHVTHQGQDRLTQLYTTTHARHPPRPGQAHAAIYG